MAEAAKEKRRDMQRRTRGSASLRAPESAHQQWGGCPQRGYTRDEVIQQCVTSIPEISDEPSGIIERPPFPQ